MCRKSSKLCKKKAKKGQQLHTKNAKTLNKHVQKTKISTAVKNLHWRCHCCHWLLSSLEPLYLIEIVTDCEHQQLQIQPQYGPSAAKNGAFGWNRRGLVLQQKGSLAATEGVFGCNSRGLWLQQKRISAATEKHYGQKVIFPDRLTDELTDGQADGRTTGLRMVNTNQKKCDC